MTQKDLMIVISVILVVLILVIALSVCVYKLGYHNGYISGIQNSINKAKRAKKKHIRTVPPYRVLDRDDRQCAEAESVRIVSTHMPRKENYNELFYKS